MAIPLRDHGAQDEAGPVDTGLDPAARAGFIGVEIRLAAGDTEFRVILSAVGSTPDSTTWTYHLDQVSGSEAHMEGLESGQVTAAGHHEARRLAAPILAGRYERGTTERALLDMLLTVSR